MTPVRGAVLRLRVSGLHTWQQGHTRSCNRQHIRDERLQDSMTMLRPSPWVAGASTFSFCSDKKQNEGRGRGHRRVREEASASSASARRRHTG